MLTMVVVINVFLQAGCETDKGWLRGAGKTGTSAPVAAAGGYDLDAIRDGTKLEIPGDEPDSVLKPTRTAAAWSAEARAIERSLGVMP
jgi:hypothetical protein